MTQQLDPPSGTSAGSSYPDVAAALLARAGAVAGRWEPAARAALPQADGATLAWGRDDLPRALAAAAATLGAGPDGFDGRAAAGPAGPFPDGWSVREFLAGRRLLRRPAAVEVEGQLGRPLSAAEADALAAALDAASDEAVAAFADHQAAGLRAVTERHGKYLSFLSHDLRGGLNGIFLMTEVLRRELGGKPEFAETVADVDMMRRSVLETVATLDRFVYAERFRKGKVQARPVRLNLSAVLREIEAQFGKPAQEKGVTLVVEAPERADLVSDRELLVLIVQNLVSNAVKFAGRGTVRVAATPLAGGGWRVAVSDEGKGIEPEKMGHLRATLERGETGPQPGLGLSLAHQSARLLGAKVGGESEPGLGSRFYAEFPAAVAGAAV